MLLERREGASTEEGKDDFALKQVEVVATHWRWV